MSVFSENSGVDRFAYPVGAVFEKRPKILHMISGFGLGGTARQCIDLLCHLDQNRFELQLAALHREGPLFDKILPRFPEIPEFPIDRFTISNAYSQIRSLSKFLQRERISILHTHDYHSSLLGVMAARLRRIPVIVVDRQADDLPRPSLELGQQIIYRMARKILVHTEACHSRIRQAAFAGTEKQKVVVIRNGLNIPKNFLEIRHKQRGLLLQEFNLKDEVILIGMVARLQSNKGHLEMLEAISRLPGTEPEIHLLFVGDGPLWETIENRIELMGIRDRVHLLGNRDNSAELVGGFDLSVCYSQEAKLPMTLIEAMAMGVPVVATAVSGMVEVVKNFDTGFLVQPDNPEALAERIRYALLRWEETKMIGSRGRRFIQNNFSLPGMVEAVEKLYDDVLRGVAGSR